MLLIDDFKLRYKHLFLEYVERETDLWQLHPDTDEWLYAVTQLIHINRMDAYRLLGMFPQGLLQLTGRVLTEKEAIAIQAMQIQSQAKSAWLISWQTDWKDPRLFEPENFDFPISEWHEHEVQAKLSQLFYGMIDRVVDHANRATGKRAKTAFYWLMCEAAQCRRSLMPVDEKVSMHSIYEQARKARKARLDLQRDLEFPWEMEPEDLSGVLLDEDDRKLDQVWSDARLLNTDQYLIEIGRRLAGRDEKFRLAHWKPFWNLYRKFYSDAKNKGFEPVLVNDPPKKRQKNVKNY